MVLPQYWSDPAGRLVASALYNETVRIWQSQTGTAVRVLQGSSIDPSTSCSWPRVII